MSDNFEIIDSSLLEIIRNITANNENLTPELQNAIAAYLTCLSTPPIVLKGASNV